MWLRVLPDRCGRCGQHSEAKARKWEVLDSLRDEKQGLSSELEEG
jgi:hypothetical protein